MSRLYTSELYFHIEAMQERPNCQQSGYVQRLPLLHTPRSGLEILKPPSTRTSMESFVICPGSSSSLYD